MNKETLKNSCLYDWGISVIDKPLHLFETPKGEKGRTHLDTNMEMGNQLPKGRCFTVRHIDIAFTPNIRYDDDYIFHFNLGSRRMYEWCLRENAVLNISEILIPSNQYFGFVIYSPLQKVAQIRVSLWGDHSRQC